MPPHLVVSPLKSHYPPLNSFKHVQNLRARDEEKARTLEHLAAFFSLVCSLSKINHFWLAETKLSHLCNKSLQIEVCAFLIFSVYHSSNYSDFHLSISGSFPPNFPVPEHSVVGQVGRRDRVIRMCTSSLLFLSLSELFVTYYS